MRLIELGLGPSRALEPDSPFLILYPAPGVNQMPPGAQAFIPALGHPRTTWQDSNFWREVWQVDCSLWEAQYCFCRIMQEWVTIMVLTHYCWVMLIYGRTLGYQEFIANLESEPLLNSYLAPTYLHSDCSAAHDHSIWEQHVSFTQKVKNPLPCTPPSLAPILVSRPFHKLHPICQMVLWKWP